jgi:hypothetical protein
MRGRGLFSQGGGGGLLQPVGPNAVRAAGQQSQMALLQRGQAPRPIPASGGGRGGSNLGAGLQSLGAGLGKIGAARKKAQKEAEAQARIEEVRGVNQRAVQAYNEGIPAWESPDKYIYQERQPNDLLDLNSREVAAGIKSGELAYPSGDGEGSPPTMKEQGDRFYGSRQDPAKDPTLIRTLDARREQIPAVPPGARAAGLVLGGNPLTADKALPFFQKADEADLAAEETATAAAKITSDLETRREAIRGQIEANPDVFPPSSIKGLDSALTSEKGIEDVEKYVDKKLRNTDDPKETWRPMTPAEKEKYPNAKDGTFQISDTSGQIRKVGSGGINIYPNGGPGSGASGGGGKATPAQVATAAETGTPIKAQTFDPLAGVVTPQARDRIVADLGKKERAWAEKERVRASSADEDLAQMIEFEELMKREGTGSAVDIAEEKSGVFVKRNFNKDNARMHTIVAKRVPGQRVAGSGTTSDKDMELYERAELSVSVPSEANAMLIAARRALIQRAEDYAAYRRQFYAVSGAGGGANHSVGHMAGWRRYVNANPLLAKNATADNMTLNKERVGWKEFFSREANKLTTKNVSKAAKGAVAAFESAKGLESRADAFVGSSVTARRFILSRMTQAEKDEFQAYIDANYSQGGG